MARKPDRIKDVGAKIGGREKIRLAKGLIWMS